MAQPKSKELDQGSIYDASSAEIRAYGVEACGIEFDEEASRGYMIDQIVATQGWLQRDPEEGATHVEITIAKEPGKEGNFPWRGGANGEMFSVQRGTPVTIPMRYYEAIRSANQRAGFVIRPLDDHAGLAENSPSEERIALSGTPVTVHRFITQE